MAKMVNLIEDLGYCIRVPETDVARYEAQGYRRWNGPVPKPGQHTIHAIPGIQDILAKGPEAQGEAAVAPASGDARPEPKVRRHAPRPVTDAPGGAPARPETEPSKDE